MEATTTPSVPAVDEFVLLFGEDLARDDMPVVSTVDASRKVAAIRTLEKQIGMLELQAAEAKHFFEQRVQKCQERIDHLKFLLQGYLNHMDLKNLATPYGTIYQRTVKVKNWPEPTPLLSWAESHFPEGIRIKKEPDKKAIYEHIAATGDAPEGFTESSETRLYIK